MNARDNVMRSGRGKMARANNVQGKVALAVSNLKAGYSCSEAVLIAYGPDLGLAKDAAFKIASGFGGGMGLKDTCGAVTAACMVIGLKYGAAGVEDSYSRQLTHEIMACFVKRFQVLQGSILCRDLIGGMDISGPQGRANIREKGRVPQIVACAVTTLEGLFAEND